MILKKLGKKGIGVGQVFVFIIAAITFSLIMIFGYKAISGFLASGEQVEFVQFKTDLETSVRKIYTEFDSVRINSYRTPSKFEQICFIDLDAEPTPDQHDELCAKDGFACTIWEEATGTGGTGYAGHAENVFLKPPSTVPIKVFRIKMPENFLCLDINGGKFDLVLKGQGDHTLLRKKT
jgi:hypothetical protein